MADDPRELVAQRLAHVYTNQMGALRDGTERGVGAVWDTLGAYNRADISSFLERALPIVEAAQTQAAALTDAYIAQAVQILTGEASIPEGIAPADVVGAAVRNGTAPETVYERSFIQVWSDLSDGVQWVDAVARGGHRSRQAARTDVSLSARQASQEAMSSKPHIVGYRRVLDGHSCRFCAVASTQRYHKGDLMPLHPGCGCTVAPIVGDHDPGRIINQDLLRTLGQQSPDEFLKLVNGPKNKRGDWDRFGFVDENGHPVPTGGKGPKVSEKAIRDANQDVKVVDHGELGPTLVSDKHHRDKPDLDKRPTGSAADREVQKLSSAGAGGGDEVPPPRSTAGVGDPDESRRRLDEAFAPWEDQLTNAQREAIRRYQSLGKGYEQIQAILRGELDVNSLPASEREQVLRTIRDLRSALESGAVPSDVQVFRGLRDVERTLGVNADELGSLVGTEVPFDGFFSTTVSEDVAVDDFIGSRDRPGAAVLQVEVPEGHPAGWIANVGDPALSGQGELLLPPDTRVAIDSVEEVDGLTVIRGRVIP